ncbi:MAG TPA: TlpA disulfide reductase family protein [Gemmataceae bacterium]|nr:TlpA disulfide reductase family protein [Gemmataceae bacterium]
MPCKGEFPHLVEMHKKYGKDGFVALSVSLDEIAESRGEVDAFLAKKQATMTNLISEGKQDEWYKNLGIDAVPCVYVFNQENRFVKKLVGEKVDYKVIDAEVAKMLKK